MAERVLIACITLAFGVVFGWGFAHSTIAAECKKLGGFYVGSAVFSCTPAKESNP